MGEEETHHFWQMRESDVFSADYSRRELLPKKYFPSDRLFTHWPILEILLPHQNNPILKAAQNLSHKKRFHEKESYSAARKIAETLKTNTFSKWLKASFKKVFSFLALVLSFSLTILWIRWQFMVLYTTSRTTFHFQKKVKATMLTNRNMCWSIFFSQKKCWLRTSTMFSLYENTITDGGGTALSTVFTVYTV